MATAAVLQSRPVGSLACQRDSYLRTLDTEVVSCVRLPQEPKSSSSKRESKKSKDEAEKAEADVWQVEFKDSVLFPEGGGQPSDHGTLQLLGGESDKIPVTNIQRAGLRSLCHSPSPLEPGQHVRQQVNAARRWDHMQQHTGQHLLSAIMDTCENLETLGWGMGQNGSSNYVDLPRTPSREEIREIERRCNDIIRDDVPIEVLYPEGEDVAEANGEDKHEKGVIRVIKIGDIDSNPCCGTHLRQTSHINLILLQSTQPMRGGQVCRLYFLCGDRALSHALAATEGMARIAYDLSCGTSADDIFGAVQRIKGNAAEGRRKELRLLKEIAKFEGERVKVELDAGRNAWCYRAQEGMEFVQMVLFELKQTLKDARDVFAVFALGEEKKAGQVVVVGGSAVVDGFAKRLLESGIEVKGNGKGERWQGKVVEWKKGDIKKLEALVKEPVAAKD